MKKAVNVINRCVACGVDLFKMVQIWGFDLLYDHVWNHDLPDISGIFRGRDTTKSNKVILDLQSSMEMGI